MLIGIYGKEPFDLELSHPNYTASLSFSIDFKLSSKIITDNEFQIICLYGIKILSFQITDLFSHRVVTMVPLLDLVLSYRITPLLCLLSKTEEASSHKDPTSIFI
jgi:hypothetical protein